MILIRKLYQLFFFAGLFFLPFNSSIPKWFSFLGEYSRDSAPIFFLIALLFLLLHDLLKGSIYFPFKSTEYSLFLLFVVMALISSLWNLPDILGYYFKQTTGIKRLINQFISLSLAAILFFYLFVNVCRDYGIYVVFLKVRKVFLISFLIVCVYSILELFIINFQTQKLMPILNVFDYLPFTDIVLDYRLKRISGPTYEPPALSSYLLTISGFMFSYIISSRSNLRFVPFVLVVLLALMSKSRTALVVIFVQILVGVYFAYKIYPKFRSFINKSVILGFILLFFGILFYRNTIAETIQQRIDSLNFSKNVKSGSSDFAVSNKSRLGIQLAIFEVYKENPILGTGWGQQAFESRFLYPAWAIKDNYEFPTKYLNEKIKSFPPGFNLYIRILAETGTLGFLVFIFFLVFTFFSIIRMYRLSTKYKFIAVCLLILFTGQVMNWLQIDSFRLYGFWLCLAILIILKKELNAINSSTHTSLQ